MTTFISAVKQFVDDEEGVTAIEYGLIAALIVAVIAVALGPIGTNISTAFTTIAGKFTSATSTPSP